MEKDPSRKRLIRSDSLIPIPTLHKWFALSTLLLFLTVSIMVFKDHDREWKDWQKKYRQLEIQRVQKAIWESEKTLQKNQDPPTDNDAKKQEISPHPTLPSLLAQLEEIAKKERLQTRTFQKLRTEVDALKWRLERVQKKPSRALAFLHRSFEIKTKQLWEARRAKEQFEQSFEIINEQVKNLLSKKPKGSEKNRQLRAELSHLKWKEKSLRESSFLHYLRNAPLLDSLNPSLRIEEISIDDLWVGDSFSKISRRDFCLSCHVPIAQKGYEKKPNPLTTHPNLSLFLSYSSPHPIDRFGCTLCHSGLGSGLSFQTTGHTPSLSEQKFSWYKKYGWKPSPSFPFPMLEKKYLEGSCYRCHQKEIDLPSAKTLQQGTTWFRHFGCYGCHVVEGWEDLPNRAPSLKKVLSKVAASWIQKWLENPTFFRPSTNMPTFFDTPVRGSIQIAGILAFLKTKTEPWASLSSLHQKGNPSRGEKVFQSKGCLGCHTLKPSSSFTAEFGPDLSTTGSKLSPSWIFAWLQNPKKYETTSRMPLLELTQKENEDLTSFLSQHKNSLFDQYQPPPPDSTSITNLAFELLRTTQPLPKAEQALQRMPALEKLSWIGEKTILHYGCFGCHSIEGFEQVKKIGSELTHEASKPLSQFDFGFKKMERTLPAWISQKISSPRSFDEGKIKEPQERLRMPQFNLTPSQIESLTTFILGLRKQELPSSWIPQKIVAREVWPQGRKLIHQYNCRGCHAIEGFGGNVISSFVSRSEVPPNLLGEGRRVHTQWLFQYLQNPTVLRRWLSIRMPRFSFSSKHANLLTQYFLAQEQNLLPFEPEPNLRKDKTWLELGKNTFQQLLCSSCHREPNQKIDSTLPILAPELKGVSVRLRYDWLLEWLKDPPKFVPETRMPQLFFYDGQPLIQDADQKVQAVRDYLYLRP